MLKYAVCEILGKQYKIIPNQSLNVAYVGDNKNIEVNVLLQMEASKLKIGKPYLKEKLTLKCLENMMGEKVRVAKFHAKANYRKIRGSRQKFTKVILDVKKA